MNRTKEEYLCLFPHIPSTVFWHFEHHIPYVYLSIITIELDRLITQ